MFSRELKVASYCKKRWFKNKYKRRFSELDTFSNMRYKKRKSDRLVYEKI